MGDPFSIASGAAGLISLGITVAHGLFRIANGIGSAGEEVRGYAEEIDAFAKLLRSVKNEIESSTAIAPGIQSVIRDVFDICERVLKPLNGLQNTLRPLLEHFRSSPSRVRQLGLRIEWIFRKKAKVLFYRDALKEQHRLLDTVLAMIILSATKVRCPQNTYIHQVFLQNSIAAVDLSRRANPHMELRETLQRPLNEFITANALAKAGSAEGPRASVPESDHGAFVRLLSNPEDSGLDLEEQVVLDAEERIELELGSETPESTQEISQDICALRRKVIRMASAMVPSEMESDMATEPEMTSGPEVTTKPEVTTEPEVTIEPEVTTGQAPATSQVDHKEYTVALFCTHVETEVAVRAALDTKYPDPDPQLLARNDDNRYMLGELSKHKVVVTRLPRNEDTLASSLPIALVVSQLKNSFPNVLFGLLVSAGSGVPTARHDIRLGDVVVSTPGYEGSGVFQFAWGRPKGQNPAYSVYHLNQPPAVVITAVESMKTQCELEEICLHDSVVKLRGKVRSFPFWHCATLMSSDVLFPADYEHPDPSRTCDDTCSDDRAKKRFSRCFEDYDTDDEEADRVVHLGLVGSGDLAMHDASFRDWLAAETEVMCFEPSAAGVVNFLPSLVICGICNYSDTHQYSREWRRYAALAAAVYARDLLAQIQPTLPSK